MGGSWVKIQTQEVEAFTKHTNSMDSNTTQEDVKGNSPAFLDCAVHIKEGRCLNTEAYRKPTYIDQYLHFDFH